MPPPNQGSSGCWVYYYMGDQLWRDWVSPCPEQQIPLVPAKVPEFPSSDPIDFIQKKLSILIDPPTRGKTKLNLDLLNHDLQEDIDRQRDAEFRDTGQNPLPSDTDMEHDDSRDVLDTILWMLEEEQKNKGKGKVKHPERDPTNQDKSKKPIKQPTKCHCVQYSPKTGWRIQLLDENNQFILGKDGKPLPDINQKVYDKVKKEWVPNPELEKYGIKFNDNPQAGQSCCSTSEGRKQEAIRRGLGKVLGGVPLVGSILSQPTDDPCGPDAPHPPEKFDPAQLQKLKDQGLSDESINELIKRYVEISKRNDNLLIIAGVVKHGDFFKAIYDAVLKGFDITQELIKSFVTSFANNPLIDFYEYAQMISQFLNVFWDRAQGRDTVVPWDDLFNLFLEGVYWDQLQLDRLLMELWEQDNGMPCESDKKKYKDILSKIDKSEKRQKNLRTSIDLKFRRNIFNFNK